MTTRRQFLSRVGAGLAGAAAASMRWPVAAASADVCAFFVLNTQDFSYPELSRATVERVLDLHEDLGVPLDVSLTTTMTDLFAAQAPSLLERLRDSRVATVNYHTRPPQPYHTDYDWLGLTRMTSAQLYDAIMQYETHGLDLVTGQPTAAPGSFQRLADLMGEAPVCVGNASNASLQTQVDGLFGALGASMVVVNGRAANIGEKRNGLYLRPEHCDLKLFEHFGEDPATVLTTAMNDARAADGGRAPYFVGIKMHDNDFFAEDSAWTTVYLKARRKTPNWDTTRKSPLLSADVQKGMWNLYEGTVRYAASLGSRMPLVNVRRMLDLARAASR